MAGVYGNGYAFFINFKWTCFMLEISQMLTFDPSTCIDDDGYIGVGVAYDFGEVTV